MSKPILDGLFEIDDPHRLQHRPADGEEAMDSPYTAVFYNEVDEDGNLISTYRYWEVADGVFYGGERYTPDGRMLQRCHRTRDELMALE